MQKNLFTLDSLRIGDVLWSDQQSNTRLHVIHPSFVQSIDAADANSSSAALILSSGEVQLMTWPGDLEIRQTAAALKGAVTHFLFGPHHGAPSDYPGRAARKTNRRMAGARMQEIRQAVAAIAPQRAFISVKTGNQYHHPRPGYLLLLARQGAKTVCSQITRCCDRKHVSEKKHVFPGAGMLGLRPARSGVSCRGAMRIFLKDGQLYPDQFEAIHLERLSTLLRPQCLRTN